MLSLIPGSQKSKMIGGENSNMNYVSRRPGGLRGPQGLPLFKPPYGIIVAIDLNTGEHLGRVPDGDTPASVKNHPVLKSVKLPVTGKQTHATVLVTKSLFFYGHGRGAEPYLHVLDKKTGRELTRVELPATTNTAPMTYMHRGGSTSCWRCRGSSSGGAGGAGAPGGDQGRPARDGTMKRRIPNVISRFGIAPATVVPFAIGA